MTDPVTRYATKITVIEDAVFEILEFQFDGAEAEQASPTAVTFPALMEIPEVKKFKLDSGSILVHFGHGK
jgi:hypothetical protein